MRFILFPIITLLFVLVSCEKEVQPEANVPSPENNPDYREQYCGDWEIYVHKVSHYLLGQNGPDTTHYYHTHLNATISMDPNSADSLILDRGMVGWATIKFPVDGAGTIYNCASNGNFFDTDSISFHRMNSGDCENYSAGGYSEEYITGIRK